MRRPTEHQRRDTAKPLSTFSADQFELYFPKRLGLYLTLQQIHPLFFIALSVESQLLMKLNTSIVHALGQSAL